LVDDPKYAWLKGEPSLAETFADPIVHLVLERSGLTVQDLRELVAEAMRTLSEVDRDGASIRLPQGPLVQQSGQEPLSLT